jgi:hypothetical protein
VSPERVDLLNVRARRRIAALDEARRVEARWMLEAAELIARRLRAEDVEDEVAARAFETASADRVVLATIVEPLAALGWFFDWVQDP